MKLTTKDEPCTIEDLEKYVEYIFSNRKINRKRDKKDLYLKLILNENNNYKFFSIKNKIDFNNLKKLELKIDLNGDIYFNTIQNEFINNRGGGRGRGRGRGNNRFNNNINQEKNERLINPLFEKYTFLKDILEMLENKESKKSSNIYHHEILNLLEKSPFDFFSLIYDIDNYKVLCENKNSINKKDNSIEISLEFNNFNEYFLKRLSNYKKVKLNMLDYSPEKEEKNILKKANLFKYDINSKVEDFSFVYCPFQSPIYYYSLEFPINFNNLIALSLEYNIVLNENLIINFPLTEKKCDIIFSNLKYLHLFMYFDCDSCLYNFKKDIIQNLSINLKFCPILERFNFINEHLKYNFNEIIYILEGIKVLYNLREFRLYDKTRCFEEINEEIFYKFFPEYIEHCPFLNNIKIQLSDFNRDELLFERNKIEYKFNDIIIKNYKYIKTLGKNDSFETYLCENDKNIKVVIRKFKKSIIEKAYECFNNEKYCLEKFKNNPNIINYIEFLEDEKYEYIV